MFKFRALVRDRDGAGAMGGSVVSQIIELIELIGSSNASSSDESSSEEEEKDSFCVYI